MGYAPRALLAGGLGFAVSFLVACGGGSGLLSADQASSLNGQLDQVSSAVERRPLRRRGKRDHDVQQRGRQPPAVGQPDAHAQPRAGRLDRRASSRAQGLPDHHVDDEQPRAPRRRARRPRAPADDARRARRRAPPRARPRPPRRRRRPARLQPRTTGSGTTSTTSGSGGSAPALAAPAAATAAAERRLRDRRQQRERTMTGTTTIAGRYRIEGRLGVGGMSTVHLAFDQRLERYVALKLLAEHLADDPTFVSRFRREALAAARLVHPNIVQVFDFGFDEGHHQHFIVMEHVPGHSCAELLRDRGHLDVDQARRRSSAQACRGLDYAHRNGVVHRDVKPGQPARLRLRRRQARRLRDRPRHRPVEHHPGRLGARHRRLPRARAGPRRGGRTAGRHLLARRRHLPAALRPAALRGELAVRARAQAAARVADAARRAEPVGCRPSSAEAVAMALAIDQEARPPDAALLSPRRSRNGAHGVSPLPAGAPTAQPRDARRDPRAVPAAARPRPRRADRARPGSSPARQAPPRAPAAQRSARRGSVRAREPAPPATRRRGSAPSRAASAQSARAETARPRRAPPSSRCSRSRSCSSPPSRSR